MRELDETPAGLLTEIIELRAFQAAWQHIIDAKSEDEIRQTPMVDFALDVRAARDKALLEARRQALGEPQPVKPRDKSRKRGESRPVVD